MAPGKDDQKSTVASAQSIMISANSFWNITNFRAQLVEALAGLGHPLWIVTPSADADWAKARGADIIDISVDRSGLNPIRDVMLWRSYVKLFRTYRPAFYLGFTVKPNIYGCLAAGTSGVIALPNVSGLGTAFMNDGPLSRLVTSLYRRAFHHCPMVFFQNPDDRELFLERAIIRREQANLLPGSGIDLVRFAAQPPPPDDGELRFLLIARLLGDKGVREFVDAARLLREDYPRWRFQLLGDLDPDNRSGIPADELHRWTSAGLVEHLGHADDVRPYIAGATAVVLPSYREGLPRSLLEGAAMARPLIATDVPGNRQLVAHAVTGLLCDVRNPLSLAGAMRHLGTMDREQRARMGRAGREMVERHFGTDQVVRIYLEALRQLATTTRV